ncbi:MAG: hypothetical protein K9N23_06225 [Akkermansiaceae bacterium]|nr:hypothetical protein [Akkermansiaceae bacterium]MCF7731261.1 hypothetical protein [Akkermansiaceae bacterium]
MNPITPWLDADEVRQLAAKLLSPPAGALGGRSQEAGFDAGFVGFSPISQANPMAAPVPPPLPAPVPAPVPAPAAAPVPRPEMPAPPPVAVTPAAPPPPADPLIAARGPFLDRIGRFRDWLHHHFGASGVFILDREGFVIFDESGHGKLHFLARSLALTSRRPGNPAGNVHVKIGTSATLEVIPVETPYGWLVLGAVVPEPMQPAAITVIIEALTQVAAPPATGG